MLKAICALFLLAGALPAQDDKAADEALEKFKAEYKGDASNRIGAVTNLAEAQHDKVLTKLCNILMGDPEASVRVAAARGIGAWKEHKTKAAAMLMNALGPNARVSEVRIEIFKAMGALEDPVVLPGVHKTFEDKDSKVAKAAIESTGEIRHRDSIQPIIDYMEELERKRNSGGTGIPGGGGFGGFNLPGGGGGGGSDPQQQRARDLLPALLKAIQSITLERYATAKEWEIWWKRNQATFKVPPKPAPPPKKKK